MTDSGPEPADGAGDHATLEEVAAALDGLSASELRKVELQARILVRGTAMEPSDLINTVVERLLTRDEEHRRRWHRKETLSSCLYRTMKSIVQDYWRRQQLPLIAINDTAAGYHADPDPEIQSIAREELSEVLKALGDDHNTADIALDLATGHSPHEIREKYALTETDYDSALKRIRRRLLKHKASGGRE
jgi:DNA-directed RNA polymerase specialized sigma24 family protein